LSRLNYYFTVIFLSNALINNLLRIQKYFPELQHGKIYPVFERKHKEIDTDVKDKGREAIVTSLRISSFHRHITSFKSKIKVNIFFKLITLI
jgi:hypothetical protein